MAKESLSYDSSFPPRADLKTLATVFEELRCGLFARAADRRIVAINRPLLDWLGYDETELLGEDMIILAPPELIDLWESELEREALDHDPRPAILAIRRKDGTTFPVLALGHSFKASDGTYLGTFSVVLDLGSVETARRIGDDPEDLRSKLSRIALELQSISMAAQMPRIAQVPLGHPDLASLSAREKEVLTYLVAGKRVPAIAEELFISPHTVRNHLKNIYSKLYVGSQSQLIELVRNLEEH